MERNYKERLLLAAVLVGTTPWAAGEIAQEPLLNRLNSVAPNLTLILDTSGSMVGSSGNAIYEYGTDSTNGPLGPGPSTDGVQRGAKSPDVNKLYYDPRVRYLPRVDHEGNALPGDPPSTSWEVYFRIGSGPYETGGADITAPSAYWNLHYVPVSGSVVPGSEGRTYPNTVDSGTPPGRLFPKFVNRTDCVAHPEGTACTLAEERRNHSNWNKWYRTRALMTQTALGAALRPVVADSVRIGYGTLFGIDSDRQLSAGVSAFDSAGKQRFFNWLYSRTFSGGTPNVHAVNNVGVYYERTDSDGPWGTTPNHQSISIFPPPNGTVVSQELSSNHASCRRSFTLLVTDGYWNSGQPTIPGNADARSDFPHIPRPVGSSYVYTPGAPYKDDYANTLADVAMYHWVRDLRPDLPNRVPALNTTAGPNPSFWQNTSFYAVTLGLLGNLPRTAEVYSQLADNTRSWPAAVANSKSTIDDTWHATINGRGELINAKNSGELTDAITRILTSVSGTPQTQSGVAVSAVFLRNGTRKYKPEYVPGLWTGKLSAVELDASGNEKDPSVDPTAIHWQVERGTDINGEPISTIPAHNARNIATWNGSAGTSFNAGSTGLAASLVNYIRGDTSQEIRKGGAMRNRTARLGDIVNANPVYVRDNVDLGYENLGLDDYRGFIAYKASRQGVLFAGANDGMLHAFRDSDGVEIFAYVPRAVWPELHKLTQPPPMFRHRYFVDGPHSETDAHLGGSWRNLLLGSTGAGAKAIYALNVTTSNNMGPLSVLWEISDSTPGFGNLGHVLSEIQAGVTVNGRWIAVFGNGVGSTNGRAALFVVDLHTGQRLAEFVPHGGPGNGMGGVRLVFDGNRRVIGAYAGDLLGNLWKLDLTGDPANWQMALGGVQLFAAGSGQPISAPPTVLPHPDGGHMVVFGTGKFFETADASPPYTPQRLYGIWDLQPFGATSTPSGATLSGTARLLQRTITTTTIGQAQYFTVSSGPVAWGNGTDQGLRGWYLDLPNAGQRMVNPLEPLAGTFLLASTLSPESSAPPDICVASGSGSGWAYIIDGVTGSGPTIAALDTNGDNRIDGSDAVVGGYQDVVDGRPSPIQLQTTSRTSRLCIETAQATCTQIRLECGQLGAAACPVIPTAGIKSRTWRQLFMR